MSRSSAASKRSFAASRLLFWFEARAVPAMRRLGDLPFVAAVREALPWSFIGLAAAFAAVAILQPAPAGPSLGLRLAAALLPSFGVMAATLAVLLPLRLARLANYPRLPLLLGTLAGFALALPRPFGPAPVAYLRTLGASGLFLAMLACGVAAGATALLRRRCSLPAAAWLGAAACAVFAALSVSPVTPAGAIAASMQPISRLGDTYAALICIVLAQTLLWTAGVHGPAVLATIVTPIYLTMQMQNAHAFAIHAPLPYAVVTSTFLFVFPGGSGATLPMAALFALSRTPRLRRLGRATLLPAIFNLNEPLIFGAPVVFNPYLVVPFVAAPFVLATLTYAATAAGFVHRAAFYVPSSVPTFVSTYVATQDVRAIALVAINLALATALYYPFVRAYERHLATAA
jgi:cellobiose-specific phosphotransferase system component IIC